MNTDPITKWSASRNNLYDPIQHNGEADADDPRKDEADYRCDSSIVTRQLGHHLGNVFNNFKGSNHKENGWWKNENAPGRNSVWEMATPPPERYQYKWKFKLFEWLPRALWRYEKMIWPVQWLWERKAWCEISKGKPAETWSWLFPRVPESLKLKEEKRRKWNLSVAGRGCTESASPVKKKQEESARVNRRNHLRE